MKKIEKTYYTVDDLKKIATQEGLNVACLQISKMKELGFKKIVSFDLINSTGLMWHLETLEVAFEENFEEYFSEEEFNKFVIKADDVARQIRQFLA